MPNALQYLLVTRLKEEVGIRQDNYLLWASLFPQGMAVKDVRAKATNLGKRRYDQLLSDLAAEWADDPAKAAFVERAAQISTRARRGSHVPQDDLHRLVAAPGTEREIAMLHQMLDSFQELYDAGCRDRTELERPFVRRMRDDDGVADVRAILLRFQRALGGTQGQREEARQTAEDQLWELLICDPAKAQLVDAVKQSVSRTTVLSGGQQVPALLGTELAAHASDPWNTGTTSEQNDYRGLGFLFSDDFKESFDAMVRREFGWQEQRNFVNFWGEYRYLQERYLTGTCSEEEELDIVQTLFSLCVLACLVGPGSFVEEMGYELPGMADTVVELKVTPPAEHAAARYQLQPVVFNGHDGRAYYTSSEQALVFDVGDVVRFGRDSAWMDEAGCKPVMFQDVDVSRHHAELRHTSKGWEIVDVGDGSGSANGTLVFRAFGGPIFRKSGFSAEERTIKIQSGDIIYIAPPQGASYDVELRRGRIVPEVGRAHRAFRFERRA